MKPEIGFLLVFAVFITLLKKGNAIRCYQCDSNEDSSCPSHRPFDTTVNALTDCSSFEAKTPGTFCMKIVQESPGWGGWIKITRRCGSRADQGVAWGCRWFWEENGVWKEVCYCDNYDGCNSSSTISKNIFLMAAGSVAVWLLRSL
ncbi:unnamed protein product [Owenia fusiformis]|uniref:UPAR/Ly6 domain-containing protein qvr n=1 Tax=Owenia fusiformis TaxID=6347 RepID=A0A8J1XZF0_OWEFU|nr:unnamed protein product [Owenia fusiformis]